MCYVNLILMLICVCVTDFFTRSFCLSLTKFFSLLSADMEAQLERIKKRHVEFKGVVLEYQIACALAACDKENM